MDCAGSRFKPRRGYVTNGRVRCRCCRRSIDHLHATIVVPVHDSANGCGNRSASQERGMVVVIIRYRRYCAMNIHAVAALSALYACGVSYAASVHPVLTLSSVA